MKKIIECKSCKKRIVRTGYRQLFCKKCGLNNIKNWYNKNREHLKEYKKRNKERQSIYYKHWYKEHGRIRTARQLDCVRKYQINYPERILARNILRREIKNGVIKKPKKCSKCGAITKIHGHHNDYLTPLRVIWLCASCHKKMHCS